MPFEIDELNMYPPSQSYKPYQDGPASEDASEHGGEDDTFLEKPISKRKTSTYRQFLRRCGSSSFFSASVVSCMISTITAILVLILILVSTQGQPMKVIKETARKTFTSDNPAIPLHGHGPSTPMTGPSDSDVKSHHDHDHGSSHANSGIVSCGSSPAEARSLGCVFDIMSFAWTPPSCYNHTKSQEYLARNGPWIFYLDHNATQPLEFDTLADHEVVWTEHSYHVVHCLYAWERGHMAMDGGKGTLVPGEMGSIEHTRHCVDLLDDVGEAAAPARKVNAVAYLVYDSCRVLG